MRIAYISGSYLPSRQANSVHVVQMSEAMAELGHDVTLFAHAGAEPISGSIGDFYGVSQAASIRTLSPRKSARGRELQYAWALRRDVAKLRPDLVYGRHLLGLVACSGYAPFLYESHSMKQGLDARIERRLVTLRSFRGVVVITHSLAADFRNRLRLEVPVLVEPDAVTPRDYDAIAPVPLEGTGRLKIGYCGQLYVGRGAELLVRVATLRPDLDVHVVGGEPEDIRRLQQLAIDHPNFHCHGFVAPADVPRYLASFDVLVAPYQSRVEAAGQEDIARWISPMKLFEYMDAGKPIVISDLPAIREIVRDDETALLAPPDDVGAWCDRLDSLRQPELRERLGRRARELVRAKHTWSGRASRVLAAFENPGATA